MRFGFVRMIFKKSSKSNQSNAVRVCAVYRNIKKYDNNTKKII
jgi:hypothetical protein